MGGSVDEVLSVGFQFATEPAGAAMFKGLEKKIRLLFQHKMVAGLQVVDGERDVVGVVVGLVVVQQTFYLLGHGTRQRDATRVFSEKWLEVRGEEVGVGDKQLAVFLLPLMTMRGR